MSKEYVLACLCLAACASTPGGESPACPDVGSIKTIPFHGARAADAAYDRLRFEAACEVVLIQSLENLDSMPDPRQAPPEARFVVSEAALFILLDRRGIDVEAVVPEEVARKMETQGIYAYFDYVATPKGRAWVISRTGELTGKQ